MRLWVHARHSRFSRKAKRTMDSLFLRPPFFREYLLLSCQKSLMDGCSILVKCVHACVHPYSESQNSGCHPASGNRNAMARKKVLTLRYVHSASCDLREGTIALRDKLGFHFSKIHSRIVGPRWKDKLLAVEIRRRVEALQSEQHQTGGSGESPRGQVLD